MMQLIINTQGTFISQKDECLRLTQKEKVFDISPLKVESIVITNQAMISTQAVAMALEHNIDIIFLDGFGDPLGRVWFSKMGSTALIRSKQKYRLTDKGRRLIQDSRLKGRIWQRSRSLRTWRFSNKPGRLQTRFIAFPWKVNLPVTSAFVIRFNNFESDNFESARQGTLKVPGS